MKHLFSFFLLSCSFFSSVGFSESPASFSQAKKIAAKIFTINPQTLYCHCWFDGKKSIDLSSCQMQEAQSKKRSHRVEWEHMMPAEHFGKQRPCWREAICEKNGKRFKGRKCCELIDNQFNHMEAELYNLWPSVGLINQLRSNYRYGITTKKTKTYGCNFSVQKEGRLVEPGDEVKGIVARATLFMSYRYQLRLSDSQRQLFEAWNAMFPPTPWEKEWTKHVERIEGYKNPYIG
ncbi:endonuclease [Legionella jamestowniensis]|uniref:endonuclease n=1 Tax=Legionella jamestowniensis TaxID=455 RepID=UPI0008F27911|nr:endonuclease [Legionella jamestowniensis]SFM07740.1 deoxyribonuclease-1 [Legionella jamestowniensis DSM 19215]